MTYRLHRLKGEQRCDANGDPFDGGVYTYFQRDTTTPLTVYKDEAGSVAWGVSVTLDSAGRLTDPVFVGETDFKETFTPPASSGEAAVTFNGYPGAEPAAEAPVATAPLRVAEAVSASRTITEADFGKLLRCDPSGGNIVLTLPPVSSIDNGSLLTVLHDGSSGQVVVACTGSDEIGTLRAYAVTARGHGVTLVADPSQYTALDITYARPELDRMPFFPVLSRLSAPPASPTPGDRHILGASPSGAWSSYAQHDIVEADGQGTWIRYTPPADCGWIAYVQAEDLYTSFQGSAWVDLAGATLPSTNVPRAVYEHTTSQNTSGGSLTSVTWNTAPWTTEVSDTIGCSVSSNKITVPAGDYRINTWRTVNGPANQTTTCKIRLYDVTNAAVLAYGTQQTMNLPSTTAGSTVLNLVGDFTFTASTVIRVEVYAGNATTWGPLLNVSGIAEHWGRLELTDLAGYRGAPGIQGPVGPTYAGTSTSSVAIGTGSKSFSTQSGRAYLVGDILRTSDQANSANYMVGTVSAYDTTTGALTITVASGNTGGSGTITAWNIGLSGTAGAPGAAATIAVGAVTTGAAGSSAAVTNSGSSSAATLDFTIPRGDTGAVGPSPALDYAFATSITGDPGSGKVAFNNASWGAATVMRISKTDRNGASRGSTIATWDDSSNASDKCAVTVFTLADRSETIDLTVTGSLTDQTTYFDVPISVVSASVGMPSANDVIGVPFARTGNKGADGLGTGDVSAASNFGTDNVLIRSDGTSKGVQATGISVADTTNNISGTGSIVPASNDGGAIGSATLAYSDLFLASGAVVNFDNFDVTITHGTNALTFAGAVSGYFFDARLMPSANDAAPIGSTANGWSDLFLASGGVINWNNGNATITHSSGLLTINVPLSLGTSNAFTAGTVELGHATDTTLSRSAAGRLAVEGKNALLIGQTDALTSGYSATVFSAGTKSSGTYTPSEADGNFQSATNGGAHTLAPPTNACSLVIQYTNNGSAGAITTSGFTKVTGSSLTTTNGDDFMCYITKSGSFSHLHVQALQ
jgi:hypothetical protein